MSDIEGVRQALNRLRLEPLHDYDDKGTYISHLGLWDETLDLLRDMLPPGWAIIEKRRVEHDQGNWLRVDIMPQT